MYVIGHDHVGADVRAVLFARVSKILKGSMKRSAGQDMASIESARSDEIDWRGSKDSVEATQTLLARAFVLGIGGHRPPLQGERVQQLLMDSIEAAVAEDRDDVLFFQERNELL